MDPLTLLPVHRKPSRRQMQRASCCLKWCDTAAPWLRACQHACTRLTALSFATLLNMLMPMLHALDEAQTTAPPGRRHLRRLLSLLAAADPHLSEPAQQPAAPQRVPAGGDAALPVPHTRGGDLGAADPLDPSLLRASALLRAQVHAHLGCIPYLRVACAGQRRYVYTCV